MAMGIQGHDVRSIAREASAATAASFKSACGKLLSVVSRRFRVVDEQTGSNASGLADCSR